MNEAGNVVFDGMVFDGIDALIAHLETMREFSGRGEIREFDEKHVLSFTVPGKPVPKGRPRFARAGGFVKTYTPEKTRFYEKLVHDYAAIEVVRSKPIEFPLLCPLRVVLTAYMTIPASWSKKKRHDAINGVLLPTSKPDFDNLLKTLDGLNGLVWKDDAQIVDGRAIKQYSENPRMEVHIFEIFAKSTD